MRPLLHASKLRNVLAKDRIHCQRRPVSTRPASFMSSINIGTLPRLTREDLARTLLDPAAARQTAVIDVRGDDYIGGHILGSQNVPSTTLDYRMAELVRTLADKETVVFHCMLSQQRGPSAALGYARERQRLLKDTGRNHVVEVAGDAGVERDEQGQVVRQKVAILVGGFEKWQEKYGEDQRLTEGYKKDIWLMEDSE